MYCFEKEDIDRLREKLYSYETSESNIQAEKEKLIAQKEKLKSYQKQLQTWENDYKNKSETMEQSNSFIELMGFDFWCIISTGEEYCKNLRRGRKAYG